MPPYRTVAALAAAIALFGLLPTAQASHWEVIFEDDFDGSAVDATKWHADPRGGSISVSGGAVTLLGGSTFPTLEVAASLGDIFPAGMPFRVTLGQEYIRHSNYGDGIFKGPIGMWQDYALGGTRYSIAGHHHYDAANGHHVVIYEFDGANARLWHDGVLRVDTPWSGTTSDLSLGFGNPCCSVNPWNDFSIHDIKVEMLGTHSTPPVPELPTVALVAVGVLGIVAAAALRRK